MCGIVGIINKQDKSVEPEPLYGMMKAIKHRGPDDEGIYIDNKAGFGFVRLSILDISSAGHQPMISNDGSLVLVFNGEIFNYLELRNELAGFYNFKSNTDSEVVIASFLKWGENCTQHFIGMWAFAVYNTLTKITFISRDRFGIKPLYYFEDSERICFASDIPAIISLIGPKTTPNESVIFNYLMYNRTDYSEETFFTGIKKLPHGFNLKIEGTQLTTTRWYDLPQRVLDSDGFDDPVMDFRDLLIESVKIHSRSDVPVGICLSGGLDSSSILAVILKHRILSGISSYSSVFGKGEIGDETEYIDEFSGEDFRKVYAYPSEESLLADLEDFHKALVEPIPGTSFYAEYKVMKAAKGESTVLLNGQGVDEMLAGYHYFIGIYFRQLFAERKFSLLAEEIYGYLKIHGFNTGLLSYFYLSLPSEIQRKLIRNKRAILNFDFAKRNGAGESVSDYLFSQDDLKATFLNHFEKKFEHHLNYSDKSGMFFSIETRFPFLHHELVERTLKVKLDLVIKRGVTKVVMREAMRGYLPEKIRTRMDKVGYETPEVRWFNGQRFRNLFRDVANYGVIKDLDFFDINAVNKILSKDRINSVESKELWKMLSLEFFFNNWYK